MECQHLFSPVPCICQYRDWKLLGVYSSLLKFYSVVNHLMTPCKYMEHLVSGALSSIIQIILHIYMPSLILRLWSSHVLLKVTSNKLFSFNKAHLLCIILSCCVLVGSWVLDVWDEGVSLPKVLFFPLPLLTLHTKPAKTLPLHFPHIRKEEKGEQEEFIPLSRNKM